MGLQELIEDGKILSRNTINFTDTLGSGSASLGATYGILSIQSSGPCRLRLYDNEQSLENNTEKNRLFGDYNIPNTIAIIGDFSMSAGDLYTIDPMLYSHTHDKTFTYYRIDKDVGVPPITINITRFLLEDVTSAVNNRRSLNGIQASLSGSEIVSGTLSGTSVPNTYLLVSASLSGSHVARLRLYSTSSTLNNSIERTRLFETEPSESARLVVDMVLSGSDPIYFSPKIVGANLQQLSSNLNDLRLDRTKIFGTKELYYFLQRIDAGTSVPISASVYLYSLEE